MLLRQFGIVHAGNLVLKPQKAKIDSFYSVKIDSFYSVKIHALLNDAVLQCENTHTSQLCPQAPVKGLASGLQWGHPRSPTLFSDNFTISFALILICARIPP